MDKLEFKMHKIMMAGAAVLLTLSSASHAATITNYGVIAEGGLGSTDLQDGGLGKDYASISAISSGYSYQAEAIYTGTAFTPLLRAQASYYLNESPDHNYGGDAYGLQTYTYTGTSAQTYTINISLHGVATGNAHAFGDVDIIFGNEIKPYPSTDPNPYCSTSTYIFSQGFDSFLCGSSVLNSHLWATGGDTTMTDSLTFTVNPGDSFMVHAELTTTAFDGSVNAMNTFSMDFTDDTGLQAASIAPVPVPAAVWLFVSGVLGLLSISRRNRNTNDSA